MSSIYGGESRYASGDHSVLDMKASVRSDTQIVCQQMMSVLRSTISMDKHLGSSQSEIEFALPKDLPQERVNDCGPGNQTKSEYFKVVNHFKDYHDWECVSGWRALRQGKHTVSSQVARLIRLYRGSFNRGIDQKIVDAILGDVVVTDGKGGFKQFAIPEKQMTDQHDSYLSVRSALRTSGTLETNCPEQNGGRIYVGLTALDVAGFIEANPTVISSDTSNTKAAQDGTIANYAGVTFIKIPETSKDGCLTGKNKRPVLPIYKRKVGTGYTYCRELPVWMSDSIAMVEPKAFTTRVEKDPKTGCGTVDVHAEHSFGVSPRENCGRGSILVKVDEKEAKCYNPNLIGELV